MTAEWQERLLLERSWCWGFWGKNRWPIMQEPMEGFLESDLWRACGVSTSVPSVSVLVGAGRELSVLISAVSWPHA